MFDAKAFLDNQEAQRDLQFPIAGTALGAGAGAGLGALFAKLSGAGISPALLELPAVAGGVIGGLAQFRKQSDVHNAAYEQALAQLSPEEYDAVMQEYGRRMHTPGYF